MSQSRVMFVLVHGGHAGAWVWDLVRAQSRLPSLAVDLSGHGAREGSLRSLSFAECVRRIRADLPDQQQFILVGHSLGSAVVLALSEEIPERVKHIIILAGPVPGP